jgi:FkbM family methyltransferase
MNIFEIREKLQIAFWGIAHAALKDKWTFFVSSIRHFIKYALSSGLKPRMITVRLKDFSFSFMEFTGEISMYKQIFVNRIYDSRPGFSPEGNFIIFDIGSNIGIYTVKAARGCKGCTVYSFEPNPEVFGRLVKNIGLNNLSNVRAFNVGFAEKKAKAFMTVGGSTVLGRVSLEGGQFEVDIETLDSFVERENINKIDILKIDVEGFELSVLKGAGRALGITERIVMECDAALEAEATSLLDNKGFERLMKIEKYRILYFGRKG